MQNLIKRTAGLTLLLALAVWQPLAQATGCPPEGYSRQQLLDLKANGFEMADDQQRNALAVSLLGCVGEPDPLIRDGVAFEGLSTWLRKQLLQPESVNDLYQNLMVQVVSNNDPAGFQAPFAALIMSEVARVDRVSPFFTPTQRADMVQTAAIYLSGVTDYRGFSETEGWRHGVAHASDWVLQLVLNDNINAEQIKDLMTAVAKQVSPPGEVFYIYGEPGRLARAAYYAHRRNLLSDDDWKNWLDDLANPAPLESWNMAYGSQAGLARRHNTLSFLNALFLYAEAADDQQADAFAQQILSVISGIM